MALAIDTCSVFDVGSHVVDECTWGKCGIQKKKKKDGELTMEFPAIYQH